MFRPKAAVLRSRIPKCKHSHVAAKPVLREYCHPKGAHMLYTIAVILIILWLLGLVSSYTMGGFVHALLVVALIIVVANFLQGRRTV